MSVSKRHHYVPEFYLRNFVDRCGLLYVYDKDGGGYRRQTAENTAVRNRFYGFTKPDGSYSDEIERSLLVLESEAKVILERWQEAGVRSSEDEIRLMAQFLRVMYARVPGSVEAAKELLEISAIEFAKLLAERRDLIDQFLRERTSLRRVPSSAEELIESLRNVEERFTILVNPKSALAQSLSVAPAIADQLLGMNWCLCKAPADSFFLTSDTPVCVFCPGSKGALFGAGFGLPNAEVTFPISPSVCLRLDRRHHQHRIAGGHAFVRVVNNRMAVHAERYLISNSGTRSVEALVRKFSFTRKRPKLDRKAASGIMARRLRASALSGKK